VKKPLSIITVIVLVGVAWLAARHQHRNPEYTTSSTKAYASYLKGDEQLNAFQWTQAAASLREAMRLDPGFAMAQAAYAVLMKSQGSPEQLKTATARAESLAALLPDENERMLIQLRLVQYGLLQDCPEDSLLKIIQERLPKHPIVLSARAMLAMENRENAKAAEIWRQLLEVDPNDARAYNWLGYNASYVGRYDEALSYLHKYAYLAPDLANPHDSLGEILTYIGDYDQAEREFLQALEIQPDFFVSLVNLARVYIETGRLRKGVEILRSVSEEIAGTAYAKDIDRRLIGVFYTYGLKAELDGSIADYNRRYPDDLFASFYRAMRLAGQGQAEAGRALCDSFLTVIGEESYFQSEVGREHLARLQYTSWGTYAEVSGDTNLAAEYWGKALTHASFLPPHEQRMILVRYGEALLKLGNATEALAQADQCLAINPNLPQALVLRVETCLALGRWDEAERSLTRLDGILAAADSDFPPAVKARSLRQDLAERASS
jgi:tetratricopeptide (TPR) repeat protein